MPDVGTAVGDLPLTLALLPDFRGRVVGVDWSPRMMGVAGREAQRQGLDDQIQFGVVDVRGALPFAGAAFDLVFCLGLLETLPYPESVLSEFKRVLKPDGRLVLSLYRGWAAWNTALSLEWYAQHLASLGMCDLGCALSVSSGRHHRPLTRQRYQGLYLGPVLCARL